MGSLVGEFDSILIMSSIPGPGRTDSKWVKKGLPLILTAEEEHATHPPMFT